MRSNAPKTPLLALLRSLTEEQRQQFAEDAGTTVSYLYSLATCQRKQCRSGLAVAIADATVLMSKRTKGATPVISVEVLSSMCALAE